MRRSGSARFDVDASQAFQDRLKELCQMFAADPRAETLRQLTELVEDQVSPPSPPTPRSPLPTHPVCHMTASGGLQNNGG
jgi:hypothetical protein